MTDSSRITTAPSWARKRNSDLKYVLPLVDNSNTWIEGKRVAAEGLRNADCQSDPRWRFSPGKFIELLKQEVGLTARSPLLFGSEPPPTDSVWERFGQTLTVILSKKSSFTKKEKKVDSKVICAMVDRINAIATLRPTEPEELKRKRTDPVWQDHFAALGLDPDATYDEIHDIACHSVILLVSGDQDFEEPVKNAQRLKVPVMVCSWWHSLAKTFRQMEEEGTLPILYLNQVSKLVGFQEKVYFNPALVSPVRTIVVWNCGVKGPLFRSALQWAEQFSYLVTFVDSAKENLMVCSIVPLESKKNNTTPTDSLNALITSAKSFLGKELTQVEGADIISHPEYKRRRREEASAPAQTQWYNPYFLNEVFQAEEGAGAARPTQLEQANADEPAEEEEWTTVENRYRKHHTPKIRCYLRRWCGRILTDCKFGHSQEELKLAQQGLVKKLRKAKPCNHGIANCFKREQCDYAHCLEEAFCPTCESTGKHWMEHCLRRTETVPQRF